MCWPLGELAMTADHPTEHILIVNCTACGRLQESKLLMPIVTPQDRIMLLCGQCQWKMRPKEAICCTGEDER